MKIRLVLVLSFAGLSSFLCLPAVHAAESERFIAPVPPDWIRVLDEGAGDAHVTEHVPPGESASRWTHMITVQLFRGLTPKPTKELFDAKLTELGKLCPGGQGQLLRSGAENGYEYSFGMHVCDKIPGAEGGESTVMKVVKGEEALYLYLFAFKTQAGASAAEAGNLKDTTYGSSLAGKAKVCNDEKSPQKCAQLLEEVKNFSGLTLERR